MTRRELAGLGAALAAGASGRAQEKRMYGLIGKFVAKAGQREALMGLLLEASHSMPGCLSYVVARDAKDEAGIWVTEVWDSPDSHRSSLSLPAVQQAIQKARPLIEGFGDRFETQPVGGHGLGGG